MFNRIAGIIIGTIFYLIYTGRVNWFSNFNDSVGTALNSDLDVMYFSGGGVVGSGGVTYLYIPAILSVFCLIFPSLSARFFSPKDNNGRPILEKNFWFIPGYFLALVGWGLLYVYK